MFDQSLRFRLQFVLAAVITKLEHRSFVAVVGGVAVGHSFVGGVVQTFVFVVWVSLRFPSSGFLDRPRSVRDPSRVVSTFAFRA